MGRKLVPYSETRTRLVLSEENILTQRSEGMEESKQDAVGSFSHFTFPLISPECLRRGHSTRTGGIYTSLVEKLKKKKDDRSGDLSEEETNSTEKSSTRLVDSLAAI
jgi:hypothetical protein